MGKASKEEAGRKAGITTKRLAGVRAEAYQFIRENPGVRAFEVAKRFGVYNTLAGGWIRHCRQHKMDKNTKPVIGEKEISKGKPIQLTFDQAAEAIIFAFEQATLVPSLKEQVYRLENKLAATKNELENLQKYYKEKEDQSKRFRLAQQQGEIGNKIDF